MRTMRSILFVVAAAIFAPPFCSLPSVAECFGSNYGSPSIEQLFPNPSNGAVQMRFRTFDWGEVHIQILDIQGRVIRQQPLTGGAYPPGPHQWTWDGRDESGRLVPRGIYRVSVWTKCIGGSSRGLLMLR